MAIVVSASDSSGTKQRRRGRVAPLADGVDQTHLDRPGSPAQSITQRRARLGIRHPFQRITCGVAHPFVPQHSGQRRHGFRRAADSQLLASGAFLDDAGVGLQNGNEILFRSSPGRAGREQDKSGKKYLVE